MKFYFKFVFSSSVCSIFSVFHNVYISLVVHACNARATNTCLFVVRAQDFDRGAL